VVRDTLTLSEVEEEPDIIKRAYLAGRWVGYTGNSDWMGVGRRVKRGVLRAAEEAGLLREALEAYRQGKFHGRKAREREILEEMYSGLSSEGSSPAVRHDKRVPLTGFLEPSVRPGMGRIRSIGMVKMLGLPGAIRKRKFLLMPRFLRRG